MVDEIDYSEKLKEDKQGKSIKLNNELIGTLAKISVLAFPVTIYYWCIFLEQAVLYYFIGKKYPDREKVLINSMGITNIYMNTIALSISIGLLSGIDTLCSNAFGAGKNYLVGVYWQRGKLITFIFTILFGLFNFFFGSWLLSFITTQNEVLVEVDQYIRIYVFSLFFEVFFASNIKYLNIVNKAHIPLIIVIITMITHVLFCWILIDLFDLGISGGAFAILITNVLNSLFSSLYIYIFNPSPESYFWINKDCLKEWKEYLRFTIPSIFLVCFEWWAFEIQSLIVFFTTMIDFNAHIIGITLYQIIMSVTAGFATSMGILTGKTIVEKGVKETKQMALTIAIFGNIISMIFIGIYYFYDIKLFEIFVNKNLEPEVIDKARVLVKIMLIVQFFDFQQSMYGLMYKSLRLQVMAAVVIFIGFYIVQISVSIFLAIYLEYGVVGSWLGIASGTFFNFVAYSIIYFYIDMENIKENILKRINKDLDKLECKQA